MVLYFVSQHLQLGDQSDIQMNLFLQPSYEIEHLLLHQQGGETNKRANTMSTKSRRDEHRDEWKSANRCYFKCLAMVQQFFQSSLKFHKDLDLEQVDIFEYHEMAIIM
jgi:hypothetical protein